MEGVSGDTHHAHTHAHTLPPSHLEESVELFEVVFAAPAVPVVEQRDGEVQVEQVVAAHTHTHTHT